MLRYLFLFLFVVFSAIHLKDSWKDDAGKRAKTKPFLLLFLALYYLCATDKINIFLLLALVTSWLGDVLLIRKGHKWFAYGGISFMFCHFFFIAVYAARIHLSSFPWLLVVPAVPIYYGISLKIILALRPTTPKSMVVPMYIYLLANSTMNIFAFMQLLTTQLAGAWVAFIGAVLFFISDCTLFLVRYYKNENLIFKKHFTVMLSYLLGEFLITQGILML